MPSQRLLLPALFLTLAVHAAPSTSDWPQFRGPNRDGVSPEIGLLREWPNSEPEVLWRIEVGRGFSSVAAVGDRLYTMWDEADEQFLVCLDAGSGKLVWRKNLGAGFRHPTGGGPRCTPLVDRGIVFAVGTQGSLVAVDAKTGELRWELDMVEEYGCRLPVWGYSSSPLVVGDRLFVETGGEDTAYAAFDRKTGEELWGGHADALAYSSPMPVSVGGVDQVVFWSAEGLHAIAPDSGEELWQLPWGTYCAASGAPMGCGTPIFIPPNQLFLSSGSGTGLIEIAQSEDD